MAQEEPQALSREYAVVTNARRRMFMPASVHAWLRNVMCGMRIYEGGAERGRESKIAEGS